MGRSLDHDSTTWSGGLPPFHTPSGPPSDIQLLGDQHPGEATGPWTFNTIQWLPSLTFPLAPSTPTQLGDRLREATGSRIFNRIQWPPLPNSVPTWSPSELKIGGTSILGRPLDSELHHGPVASPFSLLELLAGPPPITAWGPAREATGPPELQSSGLPQPSAWLVPLQEFHHLGDQQRGEATGFQIFIMARWLPPS